MLGSGLTLQTVGAAPRVLQASRTQVDVFNLLYQTFLILGTLVGVVVISYMVYNAYKYRTDASTPEGQYDVDEESIAETESYESVARPELGEVPSQADSDTGKKVFLSFSISAVIVLGLIIFAYWNLLYIEDVSATEDPEDAMEVQVVGNQFNWEYTYPGGYSTDTLVAPANRQVGINATSCHPGTCDGDVMHNWGVRDLRAKTDAMPGTYTETWFQADEPGNHTAICYELCGSGHSTMRGDVRIVSVEEFRDWCETNDCMSESDLDAYLSEDGGET
jgi:cytochrome c oxidase subunit 2